MGEEQEQKFHQLTRRTGEPGDLPSGRSLHHQYAGDRFLQHGGHLFCGDAAQQRCHWRCGRGVFHDGGDPGCGLFLRPRQRQLHLPGAGAAQYGFGSNMAATGFFSALFTGLLICVFGEIFLTPLAAFLGSSPTILPYAKDYLRVILIGARG